MSIWKTSPSTTSNRLTNFNNNIPVFLSETSTVKEPVMFMTLPASDTTHCDADMTFLDPTMSLHECENSNSISEAISSPKQSKLPKNDDEQSAICVVCGEDGAKMHYNVSSCLGCKGFFRRALKKADQYECINDNNCVINRFARNSCRACRLRKCLDAGMDPAAVRPDRDFIGKQQSLRLPQIKKPKSSPTIFPKKREKNVDMTKSSLSTNNQDDLTKKLPVEMRTMLMNLLNIEIKISRGDTLREASDVYPLHINTIKDIIENPIKLKGKRTEMRYEPYRMAKNEELSIIVYRRLIAAIDWVELLAEMVDGLSTDDRISLVKSCYAPLLLFKCSARTAMVTNKENILCLCNFAYVPRNIAQAYSDAYHLDNGLVERLINELVLPFRKLQLREEELVCLSAIIVLNPMAKDLSEDGMKKVSGLRDKIQDTLFTFIKETRIGTKATCQFGNLLLYLPILANLSNVLCENLRFAQTFSRLGSFPLLTSLFGCFPVEPFFDIDLEAREIIRKNVEVQTDFPTIQQRGVKRRLPNSFVSPVENESSSEHREFRLLRPPCSYTLTEMFEDRMNEDNPTHSTQLHMQMTWPQARFHHHNHSKNHGKSLASYQRSLPNECNPTQQTFQLAFHSSVHDISSLTSDIHTSTPMYSQYQPNLSMYSNQPPVSNQISHSDYSQTAPTNKPFS